MLGSWLLTLARCRGAGPLVGLAFAHLAPLLPVRKVVVTRRLVGCRHPRPMCAHHFLLVPRKVIGSARELFAAAHASYFQEILEARTEIGRSFSLEPLALCVNGGIRQDVGQVHFHVFPRSCLQDATGPQSDGDALAEGNGLRVFRHPNPSALHHLVLLPEPPLSRGDLGTVAGRRCLDELGKSLVRLEKELDLPRLGYTIFVQELSGGDDLAFHLLAGDERR